MINLVDLPCFERANIIVFGDVMLDSYWCGATERVSPEAPVPIVKMQQRDTRPGGAANVALNLVAMGCHVNLLGAVGHDEAAKDLTTQLTSKGVACHFHQFPTERTISKLRVISRNQQIVRLDFEPNFAEYDDTILLEIFQEKLASANLVLLSDYGKGTLRQTQRMIAMAKERGIPVFIDPKGSDYSIYAGATMITPNLAEFEAVVGCCYQNEAIIVAKAKQLLAAHDFSAILVTRGKEGMSLIFSDEQQPLHFKAHAHEVFDVSGAGDTVIALLSAAFSVGVDYENAAYLANIAAGLVVQKVGTAFVTVAELRAELRHEQGIAQGIFLESQLLPMIADAKAKGEKIVMTNGCFDILHPGHIQYLNQAKKLGDRLVVAVNADDSVARLKGSSRPVNSLASRMEVLAALRVVDWVVSFSEDTPERLIREITPTILVKGGDYIRENVVGYKTVIEAGGEVVILPFRAGHSTTQMIEKIEKVEI